MTPNKDQLRMDIEERAGLCTKFLPVTYDQFVEISDQITEKIIGALDEGEHLVYVDVQEETSGSSTWNSRRLKFSVPASVG